MNFVHHVLFVKCSVANFSVLCLVHEGFTGFVNYPSSTFIQSSVEKTKSKIMLKADFFYDHECMLTGCLECSVKTV